MNTITDATSQGVQYYALKVNGQIVSRPVTNPVLLEQQKDLLPPEKRGLAEIVSVTESGKELLFG